LNYSEGIIRNTEFFTTSELADKLKMNVQVITRKVQAGEIKAYKIGKEWRIPEPSVFEWLEANVNKQGASPAPRNGSGGKGRAEQSSGNAAVTEKRQHLLEYILAQLEPNRMYGEKDLDRVIGRHADDCIGVRREFVERKMMELDNGYYRRRTGYRLSD
jgi:excisionase family DNA binding protein